MVSMCYYVYPTAKNSRLFLRGVYVFRGFCRKSPVRELCGLVAALLRYFEEALAASKSRRLSI
jgi:hypothetical protein